MSLRAVGEAISSKRGRNAKTLRLRSLRSARNNMLGFLLSLFVGWPAILATVILSLIGLLRNDYRFILTAAILSFPYSWFLSGFPILQSPVFLLPVLLLGSSYFMFRGREMLAWILGVPFFLAVLLLFFVISSQ